MLANEIMSRNVFTIHPEASVQELARLLSRQHISGVPVVNADEMIVGIVTAADIVGVVDRPGLSVADIMSHELIAVQEDTLVSEIAKLLTMHKIKRVPVIHSGKVVGIVSRSDIVDAVARGFIALRDW